jgi:hypothetical protein
MSLNAYCKKCHTTYGIKRSTMMPYLRKIDPLTFEPGKVGGAPSLLDQEEAEVLVQVAQRQDRANKGAYNRDMVQKMQVLKPNLTTKQCLNCFTRTVHQNATKNGALKKGTKVAQRTSSARSMITIPQQYRWHLPVDSIDKKHIEANVADGPGVRFLDVQVRVRTSSRLESCSAIPPYFLIIYHVQFCFSPTLKSILTKNARWHVLGPRK